MKRRLMPSLFLCPVPETFVYIYFTINLKMHQMKKIISAALVFLLLSATACKTAAGNRDARETLTDFFKALSKRDIAEARKLATTESTPTLDVMEMGFRFANTFKGSEETNAEMKAILENDIRIGEPEIEGDKATVPVTNSKNDRPSYFVLKKQDGAWKVAFDEATLSEISTALILNGQMGTDSLPQGFQAIDIDSVKKSLEEGLGKIDSLNKVLKH